VAKKKETKSGSNNNGTQNTANIGGGSGGGRINRNVGLRTSDCNRSEAPPAPRLSIPEIIEIMELQKETAIMNLSSSGLTYNGSDLLVFVTNGEPIRTIWKRILEKNKTLGSKRR
jgi:hypothetical protein